MWANSRSSHYHPTALAEFLDADEADAWLVAYALVDKVNRTIVTHEKSQPDIKRRVKIPGACLPFNSTISFPFSLMALSDIVFQMRFPIHE